MLFRYNSGGFNMSKYIILILALTLIVPPALANTTNEQQQAVHAGLSSARTLLNKAISIYDSQSGAINKFIEGEQLKLNLKKSDRLNTIKRALKNSHKITLTVVTNSNYLANEKRECDLFGTDAMVNKNKPNIIYICPKTLNFQTKALAQVIVHELIHTAESRHEFNECETAWTEHLVMLLAGAGDPYGQQYYRTCGFFKPVKKQHTHQSI